MKPYLYITPIMGWLMAPPKKHMSFSDLCNLWFISFLIKEKQRDIWNTQEKMMWRWRLRNNVFKSQGYQGLLLSIRNWKRQGRLLPQNFQKEQTPLFWTSGLQNWDNKHLLCGATQFVEICYSCYKKLIHFPSSTKSYFNVIFYVSVILLDS